MSPLQVKINGLNLYGVPPFSTQSSLWRTNAQVISLQVLEHLSKLNISLPARVKVMGAPLKIIALKIDTPQLQSTTSLCFYPSKEKKVNKPIDEGATKLLFQNLMYHSNTGEFEIVAKLTLVTSINSTLGKLRLQQEEKIHKILSNVQEVAPLYSSFSYENRKGPKILLMRKYYKDTLRGELNRFNPFFCTERKERILEVTGRLLKGLMEVHKKGVFLNDVKASNLLEDESGKVFFIDFDRSLTFEEMKSSCDQKAIVFSGTLAYFSPDRVEALLNQNFTDFILNEKEDIWAIGLILYQYKFKERHMLSSLLIEFQNESSPKIKRKLISEILECIADIKRLYKDFEMMSEDDPLTRLIYKLLNPNTAQRPTAKEAYSMFEDIR